MSLDQTTENHADRAHSSVVGGSTAERRLMCPASYQLEQKVPEAVRNKSSRFADEGTALHEAMQFILENNVTDLDEVLGLTFGDFVITNELMHDAVEPCVAFFDALDEEGEADGGLRFLIEQRCEMPGIPDAFGTSDIVARTDSRSMIVDWKFGAGVPVRASYRDDETGKERPNSQLMFYARAAMHTCPSMFENNPDWPVDLYIVQPRAYAADEIFSKVTVTVKELDDFRFRLVAAVAEAQGSAPRCKEGPWCRFAACKAVCPLHTGPLLDLSQLKPAMVKQGGISTFTDEQWGELYSDLLPICAKVEDLIGEIRNQAHAYMEAGRSVPGWKLVPKRATEKYTDDKGAARHAIGLGVKAEDTLTEPNVKSPAQLAAAMEPLMEGSTKKDRLAEARKQLTAFTSSVSSGTTLAPESDGRVDVTPTPALLQSLSKKLAAL